MPAAGAPPLLLSLLLLAPAPVPGARQDAAPVPAPAPAPVPEAVTSTPAPGTPPPCRCAAGQCGCCTGFVLGALGFQPTTKGCLNVTYDPDDFAFRLSVNINDREVYKRQVSGKNPAPACVRVPRVPNARLCWRLYNVYFIDRNLHACARAELHWRDIQLFENNFGCFRMGAQGVALLTPEDGGGLPQGGGGGDYQYDEYDDPQDDDDDDDGDDDDDDDDDFRISDTLPLLFK